MHYASQHVLSLKGEGGCVYLYSYRFAYGLLDVMTCRLLVVRFFMRGVLQASRLNSKLIKVLQVGLIYIWSLLMINLSPLVELS